MGSRSYHAGATASGHAKKRRFVDGVRGLVRVGRYSQTGVAFANTVVEQTVPFEQPQRPLTQTSVPDTPAQSVFSVHSH
jgi:hypothetical protein